MTKDQKRKEPRILPSIILAIANLREKKGTTRKEIVDYLTGNLNENVSKSDFDVVKITRAIDKGIKSGIIEQRGGKFFLPTPNNETVDHTLYSKLKKFEEVLSDLPMQTKRRNRSKSKRRSRSTSRRRRRKSSKSRSRRRSRSQKRRGRRRLTPGPTNPQTQANKRSKSKSNISVTANKKASKPRQPPSVAQTKKKDKKKINNNTTNAESKQQRDESMNRPDAQFNTY